ncbi:MAG: DeoR/GlpR family DNA-binding transcription regulator [Bacillota bacterium]
MSNVIAAARRLQISQIVAQEGQVRVADLVERFQVSDETIRRDLAELEAQGLVERNYGGAVLKSRNGVGPLLPPLEERQTTHQAEKEQIGRLGAGLVRPGNVVILDAGSTTRQVARFLTTIPRLTVITNDLAIADEMRTAEDIRVLVTGGYLKPRSRSLIGPEAVSFLQRYHADILFLGASGISLDRGLTASDMFEAEVKTTMLRAARLAVLAVDHSKFGRTHLASFAPVSGVNTIITDGAAPADMVAALRGMGVEVLLAAEPNGDV